MLNFQFSQTFNIADFSNQFFTREASMKSELFSEILLDFFEFLLKICRNFWKFHGNPLNLQISMNFRGCRDKTRQETRIETRRRPVVLPLRGAEVLVAVRGPSPGEGGGKRCHRVGRPGEGPAHHELEA